MNERPKKYMPKELQYKACFPKRDIQLFGVGEEHEPNSFGMWCDPTPELQEMLDVVGKTPDSRIIQFNVDGTDEVIYKWNQREQCWEAVEK